MIKSANRSSTPPVSHRRERGAALVTVVITLSLLLAVSSAVVYVTVLSNTSTVDVVAEKQAYDAAEAGMQITLNLLRGNGPGNALSFKDAAIRTTSNKADDWYPTARLSKWLNYTYPAAQPDRVPLTTAYDPYTGSAYSVEILSPDAVANVVPTPNPNWIDGPVVKPSPPVKPPKPAWHPWHCAHCSWDYTHCSLYNPPNNGTLRADGYGCRHKHCIPPPGWGAPKDGGYDRLLVRVTGYGPRGARQRLELMVRRTMVDYLERPLMLLRSSEAGGDMTFNISGNPEVKFDGGDFEVAFGLTDEDDKALIESVIAQTDKVTIAGKGDDFEVYSQDDLPSWLKTADDARRFLSDMELDARLRGRYFTSYPTNNDGTDSLPELTFVDGNATLTSDGAGILVVTGNLTISTDRKFKGLILVLGGGNFTVTTGGRGNLEGSIVVSKFGPFGGFLAPAVNLSGTPDLDIKHNATRVDLALGRANMAVQAIREY